MKSFRNMRLSGVVTALALALTVLLPSFADAEEARHQEGEAQETDQPDAGPTNAPPPREAEEPAARLVIATKQAPPFSIKNDDGTWSGLSIELWDRICEEYNWQYDIVETDIQGMIDGLRNGRFDAAVAAMTVTPEREELIDFSHPFYTTGLGIAIASTNEQSIISTIFSFFSWSLLRPLMALLAVLLMVGTTVWLFERKSNTDQFGGPSAEGIGAGLWWSAVTMTTVGYGDKVPRTLGGRLVALVWMFVSVVTVSSFTASIASALTVSRLGSAISGPDDLPDVRVGSVEGTTSAHYLDEAHINYRAYDSPGEGLLAVAADEVDAMVYDAPILRYYSMRRFDGRVRVLNVTFERQDYAIGLAPGCPYREQINRELLKQISSDWWSDTLYQYLGR